MKNNPVQSSITREQMGDADNVLRWTAEHLLADDQPAYGSIHQGDDQPEPPTRKGTVYALPRRRYVLDWRKACAGADIC